MPASVRVERQQFDSAGLRCAADLYLPAEAEERLPCVVLGHGFSATKDSFALPRFAERFAAAGLAALTFDYRHFGQSDGEPRQVVHVPRQRADWRAAVRHARSLTRVDPQRIALWGASFAGGHVLDLAADDPTLAAAIVQVPALDPIKGAGTETAPAGVQARLLIAALRDALHGLLGLPPVLVPVVAPYGRLATMTEPEANALLSSPLVAGTTWRNEFAPRVAFTMPRYREGTAERLAMPVLFCIAERDIQASPRFALEVAAKAPRAETRVYPAGHFGLYHGTGFERAVADQLEFLRKHLRIG